MKHKPKYSREVITEARIMARRYIKEQLKEHGVKISHVATRDISNAVEKLMEECGEVFLKEAKQRWSYYNDIP